jgi:hypothetical protein
MKKLPETALEHNWIAKYLRKWIIWEDKPTDGFRAKHLIPQDFNAYCKILHSVYADLDIAEDARTWNDVAYNSEEYRRLAERTAFPRPNFRAQRIRWAQLAREKGIVVTPQISLEILGRSFPVRLVAPYEGEMDEETASRLTEVLTQHTSNGSYYVGYYAQDSTTAVPDVLEGNLAEGLFTIPPSEVMPGDPVYWGAIDKGWCIALDYDSHFSLFAGSADLVRLLLNDPILECIGIDDDARLYRDRTLPSE